MYYEGLAVSMLDWMVTGWLSVLSAYMTLHILLSLFRRAAGY
ncbi:MAG TPA: hypothetical protein VFS21_40275 [Roseiflexaceae bacterium]|nr:hypothetical protein [Roseiflexaceae bacterium]